MRMFRASLAVLVLAGSVGPAMAQADNPQIDYQGFVSLAAELADTREAHRLPVDEFLTRSQMADAVLLDTRSAEAFRQGHIDGAINLPFSDFTDEKLLQVLGAPGQRAIYIYCNNNFSDNRASVRSKKVTLALNIPTFINLHGYGYTNVWELADIVATDEVAWVGSPA